MVERALECNTEIIRAVIAAGGMLSGEHGVGIFTGDPAVVTDGAMYLRALAMTQLSMGFEIVPESALWRGGRRQRVRM